MKNTLILSCITMVILFGCKGAEYHRAAVSDENTGRVTVGTVQREIRVGMSGDQVATVLGSPNIVSTDEERREVWIYDKISTDKAYSSSQGGIATLILGGGLIGDGLLGGAASGNYSGNSGASSVSQKTLTVIIKFSKEGRVRDFAYHTSRF